MIKSPALWAKQYKIDDFTLAGASVFGRWYPNSEIDEDQFLAAVNQFNECTLGRGSK